MALTSRVLVVVFLCLVFESTLASARRCNQTECGRNASSSAAAKKVSNFAYNACRHPNALRQLCAELDLDQRVAVTPAKMMRVSGLVDFLTKFPRRHGMTTEGWECALYLHNARVDDLFIKYTFTFNLQASVPGTHYTSEASGTADYGGYPALLGILNAAQFALDSDHTEQKAAAM